jgi:prepilin signal peptidase PulO-like enzyme (type II secretory pathway)
LLIALTLGAGVILIWQDLKNQRVEGGWLYVFMGLSLALNWDNVAPPLIVTLVIFLIKRWYIRCGKNAVGEADPHVIFSAACWLTLPQLPTFFIAAGLITVGLSFVVPQKRIPFIPGILLGAVLIKMLGYIP